MPDTILLSLPAERSRVRHCVPRIPVRLLERALHITEDSTPEVAQSYLARTNNVPSLDDRAGAAITADRYP